MIRVQGVRGPTQQPEGDNSHPLHFVLRGHRLAVPNCSPGRLLLHVCNGTLACISCPSKVIKNKCRAVRGELVRLVPLVMQPLHCKSYDDGESSGYDTSNKPKVGLLWCEG